LKSSHRKVAESGDSYPTLRKSRLDERITIRNERDATGTSRRRASPNPDLASHSHNDPSGTTPE
jgi:hypothetical protein